MLEPNTSRFGKPGQSHHLVRQISSVWLLRKVVEVALDLDFRMVNSNELVEHEGNTLVICFPLYRFVDSKLWHLVSKLFEQPHGLQEVVAPLVLQMFCSLNIKAASQCQESVLIEQEAPVSIVGRLQSLREVHDLLKRPVNI